jgi:acyl carrier protein
MMLEDTFDKEITNDEAAELITVADTISFIEDKLK